jgi:hypothetical protein
MKGTFEKAPPSLFHSQEFAGRRVLRINLRAVKELLHDEKVTSFDLTQSQMRKLEDRFQRYIVAGGRVDTSNGADYRPEYIRPQTVIKARPERMVRGKLRPATPKIVVPAKLIPATPAIEPSIDHLPDKHILQSIR